MKVTHRKYKNNKSQQHQRVHEVTFQQDSLLLRVSSLSDDPSELHLSPGIHLKPVVTLLRLCAPSAAVQIVVIIRALQATTALLHRLALHPDLKTDD